MSSLRFVGVSWLLQFKMIMRSPFDGFGNVIYPLFFATTAFFVFRAGKVLLLREYPTGLE